MQTEILYVAASFVIGALGGGIAVRAKVSGSLGKLNAVINKLRDGDYTLEENLEYADKTIDKVVKEGKKALDEVKDAKDKLKVEVEELESEENKK